MFAIGGLKFHVVIIAVVDAVVPQGVAESPEFPNYISHNLPLN